MKKPQALRTVTIIMASLLIVTISSFFFYRESKMEIETVSIDSPAAIAVDTKNMDILYQKNAESPRSIASLTKLLLVYVVMDQIKLEKLSWEDSYSLSNYGAEIGSIPSLSNVPMNSFQKYSVRELMNGVLIASANNCAITLAEGIAGSEDAFIKIIEEYLATWGISSYSLVNVTGLDPEFIEKTTVESEEYNKFSAYDMAMISTKLINDFPEVLEITKQKGFTFSNVYFDNYNKLLPAMKYGYKGVDGLKTGTTDTAGACLISTCNKDDKRIITVVLGAGSDKERYRDTIKLLDYSYKKKGIKI
ncbi:D-alanyl-D-alanine carboxypeptidase [Enterococcus avium]|uniref:D-alanyl-D-alanine carboxypeptidase n=1 Tax=Enterococcus avium TaxID=33945 RepID=A0A437UNC4_ENTAV|nr:D-alanyl-D-alanine carboxypeptidase family protein [Enterococcus avium]MDT2469364.1 D-alanyl-D-alanine carboxypeptidase [Enterococcus avium]RVU95115.1 D-alanyl-D-alanine carboxypeptidase [Enterococcus avium]